MKILIDINHPAHVHFFKNPIEILKKEGHEVVVTSRNKEFALQLLDDLKIPQLAWCRQYAFSSLVDPTC